jgi:hypothetical protein
MDALEEAVAVGESATPAVEPAAPAFNTGDQNTWSSEQRAEWNRTGDAPKAAPESAPDKSATPAVASESATEQDQQKPHLKTKEDTQKRFKDILDENKALQRRVESLERGKTPETRETKQASQPAADVYKPLDENEFFKANPPVGKPGHKTYEDFVRAAGRHEGQWAAVKAIADENQRRATAEAQKDLTTRVDEAKKIYPDFDARIQPAVQALTGDEAIPFAVKAMINGSPVFEHLLYVLGEPKALADLVATSKTNPAAAIRKIVMTESLVMAELEKSKGKGAPAKAGDGAERDANGKFVSTEKKDAASETKPRAPKPPSEVGGRGTAPGDALRTAAAANDFPAFEAEQNRRMRAR